MQGDGALVWFRKDLRLEDNPALAAACAGHAWVIPLFLWAPEEENPWAPGAASRWWLHQSLVALDASLRRLGSRLILRHGPSGSEIRALLRDTGATAVYWNRRYEPAVIARDKSLKAELRALGVEVRTFNAGLLREPWEVSTAAGRPFQVFTPFWRACARGLEAVQVQPAPSRLPAPPLWPASVSLAELHLEPKPDWAEGLRATWRPGEGEACKRVDAFVEESLGGYPQQRDVPGLVGTSRLSPYLHFGEIGPRAVWARLGEVGLRADQPALRQAVEAYRRQLVWREFAYHLLFHFPHTTEAPLRPDFAAFPWAEQPRERRAWERGRTGYPLVDAGMRELWVSGWMHNRVRMIAASFLVKHLLVPWQAGARWFWDTLVDADLANNTLGWQWTAGCGADAAPFFRIFNPVLQGERFDPEGAYVRRWLPELGKLPSRWVQRPWQAPEAVRGESAIQSYPEPVIDHDFARARALAAVATIKGSSRESSPPG